MKTDAYVTIVCGQGDTFINVVDKPVWDRIHDGDVNDNVLGLTEENSLFFSWEHKKVYTYIRENNINVIDVFEGIIY